MYVGVCNLIIVILYPDHPPGSGACAERAPLLLSALPSAAGSDDGSIEQPAAVGLSIDGLTFASLTLAFTLARTLAFAGAFALLSARLHCLRVFVRDSRETRSLTIPSTEEEEDSR